MEFADGTKAWRNAEGKLHRLDGPATILASGERRWYVNGILHRTENDREQDDIAKKRNPSLEQIGVKTLSTFPHSVTHMTHPDGRQEWYL